MKRRILILAGVSLFVLSIGFALWLMKSEDIAPGPAVKQAAVQKDASDSGLTKHEAAVRGIVFTEEEASARPPEYDESGWRNKVFLHRGLERERNGPVLFHGRIIDQEGNPVAGVEVKAEVTQYAESISEQIAAGWGKIDKRPLAARSEEEGLFAIQGLRGMALDFIEIRKEGYLMGKKLPTGFKFGNVYPQRHNSDPKAPVVFRLWKRGTPTDDLIKQKKRFYLPGDGKVQTIDFLSATASDGESEGDLRVRVKADYSGGIPHGYRWSAEIEAVEGGVIQTSDEFLFFAPKEGYGKQIRIEHPDSLGQWKKEITVKSYIQSRGGQHYSGATLRIITGFDGNKVACDFEWVTNVAGMPNLEGSEATETPTHPKNKQQ